MVLGRLWKAGLQVDIDKCEFHKKEMKFLGIIIEVDGVQMDSERFKAILEWEAPWTVKQVQAFTGLCNYYRRFVKGFSKIAKPLHKLTEKNRPFEWTEACQSAFDELKKRIMTAPVLRHFDPKATTYVETDASDYVSGGVLSQKDEEGNLHPVISVMTCTVGLMHRHATPLPLGQKRTK